jgi:hypothetical protein
MALSTLAILPSLRADEDDEHHQQPATASSGQVSLEREMKSMARDYGTIRKQVADPKQNASTLAAVMDLEQHTVLAKGAALPTAATMPTDDAKKAKQADYQGDMVTLLRHELDLEEALLANQNDKAVKIVADLHDLEGEGHKEFRPRRKR